LVACKNASKLTCGDLRFQKFSGGETPGPPLPKGRPRLTRPGRGASNAGKGRRGEGRGRGGGKGGEGEGGEGRGGDGTWYFGEGRGGEGMG
jgi:uncharacterized protein